MLPFAVLTVRDPNSFVGIQRGSGGRRRLRVRSGPRGDAFGEGENLLFYLGEVRGEQPVDEAGNGPLPCFSHGFQLLFQTRFQTKCK